jgi:ethanolamine utilization protein EutP (predicted NTPase)
MNKKDLADLQMKPQMEAILRKQGYHHVFFTNCKDSKCPGVKQVGSIQKKIIYVSESVYCQM